MDDTPNLSLPYIMPSQAQKHVTHNDALRILDAIVHLAVLDRDLATPPASPAEGERYIVAADASDGWQGREGMLAAWQDGSWNFITPRPGWLAFALDEAALLCWTSAAWQNLSDDTITMLDNLVRLGVGTEADAQNPFAAKLNKALWTALSSYEGGDGDLRYTLNKQGPDNVLSMLFQSNWSGRAEIGLVGDDDLAIKVSADGSAWQEALRVDRQTGKMAFPRTNLLADFAVSLLPDSGRFAGNAAKVLTVGSFALPSYISLVNGAAASGAGKFIHDNTSYGGTAGALPAVVKDLVDMIRDPAQRRYGPEFHVAQITKGAGTSSGAAVVGGVSYYNSATLALGPRTPAMTFHTYLRALDAPVVVRRYVGQTIAKNGVAFSEHVPITPAEGWVSVTCHDEQEPYSSDGYNPAPFSLDMATQGHRCLMACPALISGITAMDDNIGLIAGINRWLP